MNATKVKGSLALVVRNGLVELRNYYYPSRGYTRMLQSKRLGPLTEQQEYVLSQLALLHAKIDRVTSQIGCLLDLEEPDAGPWPQPDKSVAVGSLLSEAIAELDADVREPLSPVVIQADAAEYNVTGDRQSLKWALTKILRFMGLRMESEGGLTIRIIDPPDAPERWIVLAATENIPEAISCPRPSLTPLSDWHGGNLQFDVAFSNRIVQAYGGAILSLPGGLGLIVALPRAEERQSADGGAA